LKTFPGGLRPGGQAGWGNIVATAFDRHDADCVVAETNYGGAMVQEVMKTARPKTPFREVKASRGKAVRAEPVALLFDQGKAMLAGMFPQAGGPALLVYDGGLHGRPIA
jgi:phage terminase large subunit-like protein